jgi:hypothetical protein
MHDFFAEKLLYMHQLNRMWIQLYVQNVDDVPDAIAVRFSMLINNQHLWQACIAQKEAEIELEDRLPQYSWEALENDNYRIWQEILDGLYAESAERQHQICSVIFQAMQENARNLGVLRYLCEDVELPVPNEQFVPLN